MQSRGRCKPPLAHSQPPKLTFSLMPSHPTPFKKGFYMKATLIAIQPPHTTNIFGGTKIIEWRTIALPDGLHFVYETKACFGQGKVIGTFEKTRHYSFNSVDEIPDYVIDAGCVPREFLEDYAKGRKLYANVIFNAKLFETPKPYTDFKKHVVYKYKKNPRGFKGLIKYPRIKYYHKIIDGKMDFIKVKPEDIRTPPQSYMYIEVSDNAQYDYINS